ncbi:hypothetical protein JMG10_00250 [Nostoc ellipsosporum NOK]|nr:hypothetical protein [Nostoc ellipsosporum NOK]
MNKASSILMLLALIWLTVSIPFVYQAKQEAGAAKVSVTLSGGESGDDGKPASSSSSDNNPFANTTEEKPCGGVNTLTEEYLHAFHQDFTRHFSEVKVPAMHAHEATYEAFHGELLCPPPNQA